MNRNKFKPKIYSNLCVLCIHGFRYLIRDGIHHSYRKLLDFQSRLDVKITDVIQIVDFFYYLLHV